MSDFLPNIPPEFAQYAEDVLKKNGAKIGALVWNAAKKDFQSRDVFGSAKSNYIRFIREDIGVVQILGMRHGVNLEEIYIETRVLVNEEPFVANDELRESDSLRRGRRIQDKGSQDTLPVSRILNSGAKLRIMLLGDPGAGKSTSLRSIALSSIIDNDRIRSVKSSKFPIYIELRKYAAYIEDSKTTLDEYFFNNYSNPHFKDVMQRAMQSGDVIFLLDALDEVPESKHVLVAEMIRALTNAYSGCDFIVSSRIGSYRPVRGFSVYEIMDFNKTEREEYINLWFSQTIGEDRSKKLSEIIEREQGIGEITTNPLLLSLVCLLYSRDIEIPTHKSYLYDRCIQILIREWDTDRDFRRTSAISDITDDRKITILSELAHHFMLNHQRYFRIQDVVDITEEILDKYEVRDASARDFLNEVISHHGLVVKVGYEMYGFSHLTFQEYLAARYYVKNNKMREIVERFSENPRWKEVVVLAAGETNDIKTFINSMSISSIDPLDKLDVITSAISNRAIVAKEDRPRVTRKIIDITRAVLNVDGITTPEEAIRDKIIKDIADNEINAHVLDGDYTIYNLGAHSLSLLLNIYVMRARPWLRFSGIQGEGVIDEFMNRLFADNPVSIVHYFVHGARFEHQVRHYAVISNVSGIKTKDDILFADYYE